MNILKKVKELEVLDKAATPGPWTSCDMGPWGGAE